MFFTESKFFGAECIFYYRQSVTLKNNRNRNDDYIGRTQFTKQLMKWKTNEDPNCLELWLYMRMSSLQGLAKDVNTRWALLSLSQKMAAIPSVAAGRLEYPLTAELTSSFCMELKHHLTFHLNTSTSQCYKSDTYYLLKEMGA